MHCQFNRNIVWYSRYLGFSCIKQFKNHPKFKDFVNLYWDFTMNKVNPIKMRNMEIELKQK